MDNGYRVRAWARQHGYTLQHLADELGYPLHTLSEALNSSRIGPRLAEALHTRFGLRVISAHIASDGAEAARDPEGIQSRKTHALDAHLRDIKRLLDKSQYRHC